LHQQVRAQRVVIVQVLVAAAQTVQALGNQIAQPVGDLRRIARIAEHRRHRPRQADALVDPPQQHQPAVGTEVAAVEARLNDAAPNPPELDSLRGTIWHRRSSVVSRLRTPLTTRVSTRPPTSCS
jgi:hypothetical protein